MESLRFFYNKAVTSGKHEQQQNDTVFQRSHHSAPALVQCVASALGAVKAQIHGMDANFVPTLTQKTVRSPPKA
jgi:hypothetical protein